MTAAASLPIQVWDRREHCTVDERVAGEGAVRWLYGPGALAALARRVLSRRWVSRVMGWYPNTGLSRRRIAGFVDDLAIDLNEYEPGPFANFNEFFARRFRPGARPFDPDPAVLPAFAEGRYLAFEGSASAVPFPVKGVQLTAAGLLVGVPEAEAFTGSLLVARLCPADYHRYHYPDDGRTVRHQRIAGRLHSVNPLALARVPDVFLVNERRVSVLETRHLGRLAMVEVGAVGVGRIVQSHDQQQPFERGAEKGYFLFGGSTVILVGEPGRWRPDADLLARTRDGVETLVRLGEAVARVEHSR